MEKKALLKKVNSGLKIATTVTASGIFLFGITTGFLYTQPGIIDKQQKEILSAYTESETFEEFKKYELTKYFKDFESEKISLSKLEENIKDLSSKETILNHFKQCASSKEKRDFKRTEEYAEFVENAIQDGTTGALVSLASTIGLATVNAKVEKGLHSNKEKEKESSDGNCM